MPIPFLRAEKHNYPNILGFFFLKAYALFKLNEMKDVILNEIMNKAHSSVVQNGKLEKKLTSAINTGNSN